MPTRRDFEQELWDSFVEACGGRCNSCFKEVKLETGHILSEDDGGSSSLANLMPVCRSCNRKNGSEFPNDLRPADWRDRFAKILLTKFGIGLAAKDSVHTQNESAHYGSSQTDGKLKAYSWDEVVFVAAKEVYPTIGYQLLMTEESATAVVEEMALAGRKSYPDVNIAPPGEKRKGKLIALARRFGETAYRAACENFFFHKPWEQSGQWDAWEFLCSDFNNFAREGLEARLRKQEAARKRREQEKQAEADHLRHVMLNSIRQPKVEDWCYSVPDNLRRRDALISRLEVASNDELDELADEVCALAVEIQKWMADQPSEPLLD